MTPSGILNIDKPAGASSAAVVGRVKRVTGLSCGHMGTLDPMAGGVLLVGVGNATRLFDYLLDKEKQYRAAFLFGADSDTLDSTGDVKYGAGRIPCEEEIRAALSSQVGEIMQEPPLYSAKCVHGARAYYLARKGIPFTLEKKKVAIYSLDLLEKTGEGEYSFRIRCGGGTYIRAIARDLAAALGTKAIMTSLVREKSGMFDLKDAVSPDVMQKDNWQEFLIPVRNVLSYPRADFSDLTAKRLKDGLTQPFAGEGLYTLWLDGAFYGVAEAGGGVIRARTKLC